VYAYYPERLISNEEVVKRVSLSACKDCQFIYRVDPEENLYTFGGQEIDPEILNFRKICDLSLNINLCDESHDCFHLCFDDDVKFIITDENRKELVKIFDPKKEPPEASEIGFEFNKDFKLIGFKRYSFENIDGKYPYNPKGKSEVPQYEFYIKIEHVPFQLNPFHFEVHIYCSHNSDNGKFWRLTKEYKNEKPKYLHAIVSKIKNRIMNSKFLYEVQVA